MIFCYVRVCIHNMIHNIYTLYFANMLTLYTLSNFLSQKKDKWRRRHKSLELKKNILKSILTNILVTVANRVM